MVIPIALSAQSLTGDEITDICGGTQSWKANGNNAVISFRDDEMSITEAEGSLEVRQGGALIAKIEDFAFGDYIDCAERLSRVGRQRDQSEISDQVEGFLAANSLPVPGSEQRQVAVANQYSFARIPQGVSSGHKILSGYFDLLQDISDNGVIMRSAYYTGEYLNGVSKSVFCDEHYFLCERHFNDWVAFFDHVLQTGQDETREVAVAFGRNDSAIMGKTRSRTYYLAPWRVTVSHTYPNEVGAYRTWAFLLVARN